MEDDNFGSLNLKKDFELAADLLMSSLDFFNLGSLVGSAFGETLCELPRPLKTRLPTSAIALGQLRNFVAADDGKNCLTFLLE